MKTKLRLCKLLFSTRLLVSLLIILGILECLQWLQGEGKSSKSLLLSDYPELSSSSMMSSFSSNFPSSAHLPETAVPASEMTKVKIEPEKKSTHTHQNILLLAYARSGSSFTGELLSAGTRAAYYYEPLFSLRPNGTAIENVIMRDPSKSYLVERHLGGVFKCSWPLLQKLNKSGFPTIRKRGMRCRSSNPRVVKTIRLRRAGLEPWLYQTNIKVVHLVRDPRGILNSVSKRSVWSSLLKNATFQCARMLDDMKLEDRLPRERYIRVRYEDLVDDTDKTLENIYSHIGLPWTEHVRKVIWSHTHAENVTGTNGHGYYNTFRSSNFAHDSWKRKLARSQVTGIEAACKEFMERAGYKPHKIDSR